MTDVIDPKGLSDKWQRVGSFRHIQLYCGLGAALLLTLLWSMMSGRYHVPVDRVLAILLRRWLAASDDWLPADRIVVEVVRAPRVLAAAFAGAGLAVSGAVLQGIFRNPLVGPQTIGAASGAAVGGVGAILLFGFGPLVPLWAFGGAAAALVLVLLIARSGSLSPVLTLVLAGAVVSAFCGALVGLATYVADPETKLPDIVFWLLGSFAAVDWDRFWLVASATSIALAVLIGMRWRVNVLALGDEEAQALGINPGLDRLIVLAAACLAISAQVAASGTIGWIGLVIPNLARLAVGSDHRHVLPISALAGAIFLPAADTLARSLTPSEIPVGIITAILGTPIFAVLVRHNATSRFP